MQSSFQYSCLRDKVDAEAIVQASLDFEGVFTFLIKELDPFLFEFCGVDAVLGEEEAFAEDSSHLHRKRWVERRVQQEFIGLSAQNKLFRK